MHHATVLAHDLRPGGLTWADHFHAALIASLVLQGAFAIDAQFGAAPPSLDYPTPAVQAEKPAMAAVAPPSLNSKRRRKPQAIHETHIVSELSLADGESASN